MKKFKNLTKKNDPENGNTYCLNRLWKEKQTSSFGHLRQDLGVPVVRVAMCEDLLNRQRVVVQMERVAAQDRWRAMEALLTRGLQKVIV
jgi:hypothetical protein